MHAAPRAAFKKRCAAAENQTIGQNIFIFRMALANTIESNPATSALRLIIIDNSKAYMGVVRRMLAQTMPDVEVTEYDPEQRGKPGPEFDWSVYDVVLLDHQLGMGETGLDWLVEYRSEPRFPPAILMTAQSDEYLAARAIKLGASDYVNKRDVTVETIGRIVSSAVVQGRLASAFDADAHDNRLAQEVAILHRLTRIDGGAADGLAVGYRFVRLIGQGASSRVYLAERTTDSVSLVLKVIDARTVNDAQILSRFVREAEIVSQISSPYIVKFYDYGATQTYGYIAMEFFTRGDLKQRLEVGVSVADALNYLRHIALGLVAIHAQGIVHRDLKPGNIMFRADDGLALADFGISKCLDRTSDLTNHGSVLGTPNYLSPEQALGRAADQRADLYSAGVIFYEMLTGRKPFRAETASALVYQHVHADVPTLPDSVRGFQPLLSHLLAKRPDERIASAAELVVAVDRIQALFQS